MIGQTVQRYRIVGELGAGGMGVVYRAEDTHLGRPVALKFLPADLGDDAQAMERFRREARVASSLSHPHICMVHDVGEHEGRQFIVMECLEGTTLREVLANGPLPLPRALEILVDVTDALAAAHARGIVHRDVKPSNIFVTDRGDAKVMDFGLAKHVAPGQLAHHAMTTADDRTSSADRHLTGPGLAMGTTSYMSPEQARGEPLDARSDVFSLGVVIYETVAGLRPFTGDTPAVVFDGILNREPEPVIALNPAAPAALQRVLDRALQKAPAARYRDAGELLVDLRRVAQGGDFSTTRIAAIPATPPAPARRRGRMLVALAGGVLLASLGGLTWRAVQPKAAPLTDRDSILLADFTNSTTEPVFDDTLRQALAVHLGQSPFLDIVGEERINETLREMNRKSGDRLSHEVAREVCQRQGVKAMIEGAIASLGSNYVIDLTATACQDGDTLAREQVEAGRKEDVLKSLGNAATRLRATLGESLSTLRAYDTPIEQATTPSLDALKAYTLGIKERARGAEIESIPFLQRAIELDPEFASAWMLLSTVYGNLGESARATEYAGRAYALRNHVSERERLTITHQVLRSGHRGDRQGRRGPAAVGTCLPAGLPAVQQSLGAVHADRTVRARRRQGAGGAAPQPEPPVPVLEPRARLPLPESLRRREAHRDAGGRSQDRDPADEAPALSARAARRRRGDGGTAPRGGAGPLTGVRHGGRGSATGGLRRADAGRAGALPSRPGDRAGVEPRRGGHRLRPATGVDGGVDGHPGPRRPARAAAARQFERPGTPRRRRGAVTGRAAARRAARGRRRRARSRLRHADHRVGGRGGPRGAGPGPGLP